jgi:GNAT superfamily N-acetyltransferase
VIAFTLALRAVSQEIRALSDETFTLCPAGPNDVGDILEFIQELARFEKLSDEVVATEQSIEKWLFGDRPAAEAVIAKIADESVGFALFITTFSTFLGRPGIYLEDLFVRRAHRGAGIGKALLQYVAHIACERGYGRMEWAVLDWNESAIGFYEQLGAVAMDEWTTYRVSGETLRLMGRASGQ